MREGAAWLRAVAAQQSGLFTVAQAAEAGITPRTLEQWAFRGWIAPVRRSVYSFGGLPVSQWVPSVAAALAAGDKAALSHRTAGVIHQFHQLALPSAPELTVPRHGRRRLTGVTLHYTGPVPPEERMMRRGIAVTTPVRTLVDLAAYLETPLLGRILDEGAVHRLWTFPEVEACVLRQAARRPGVPALRRLLSVRGGERAPDSPLEQQVIRHLSPLGPFEVHYQLVLDGTVVILDVAWPWVRIGAEIDGRSYRQISRSDHDRESRKLTLLSAAEWKVAHLTSTMSARECVRAVLSLWPPDRPRPAPTGPGRITHRPTGGFAPD